MQPTAQDTLARRTKSGRIDDFLQLILRRLPAFVWATDERLRLTFIQGPLFANGPLTEEMRQRVIGTRGEHLLGDAFETYLTKAAPLLHGQSVAYEMEWNGRWYFAHCEPVLDAKGVVSGTTGVGIDITDRHELEEQLAKERAFLAKAEELALLGSWNLNVRSGTVEISPGLERLLGLKGPVLADYQEIMERIHPDDRSMVEFERAKSLESHSALRLIHRIVQPDGGIRHMISRCDFQFDNEGPVQCVGTMLDITERVEAERAIQHLAYHDPLTRLPNRWLLNDRLAQTIALARRERKKFYVLFIDLDRFKDINDTLGHGEGDLLLVEVANRLSDAIRETDTVARSGGDEFVVLLRDVENGDQAAAAIDKVRGIFAAPFILRNTPQIVTASIGIAVYPDDGTTEEDLLAHADTAMYDSKQSGRDAVRRYRAGSVDLTMRRLSLDAEVHAAIAGNQFLLEYQPIVDARTRNVVAAEALLRWNHPTKGLLEPSVFLDATNSRDFVNTLGEWVLNEACAQAARWRRDDGLYLRMAINVQPRHMQSDRAYIALLQRALVEHQLPAGAIELELTEKTIVRDMDWAIAILTEIRDLGFGIAIDDFGTGYNSLSYLKSFPVTTIKIDRSFVTEIGTDSFSEALSSAVAALGKARNLRVIAEGVETEEQCEKLVALGCDELQGFFFSPPISAEEFSARYCSATR